ncbi:hypothetical protein NA57DRAFT_77016 [Rhizodiscina lignyota]|uniref:FAD/NAD(P)-binding domain-containing protein n=1 Tax=Rhizodiscina lignyota TaxID=1504668 RepID=A0A9P4IFL9_9PEZI|nr:hypothetical protein NA57DRAFT_77016 [Rhizodiscina lignyota]
MRIPVLFFLVLSVFSLGAAAWPWKPPKAPVCIVGAGPAGLISASKLESKGYETVVFEKQAHVGGKCQAFYEDGLFHPLGAAFFSNASWPNTLPVIDASGVAIEPFSLAVSGPTAREIFTFNVTTGQTEPFPTPSAAFAAEVAKEIPLYAALWEEKFQPIRVPNFKKGVPDEFTVPATQWFAENNFTALPVLLVEPLALFGYGDIRVVPALYVLMYITPDVLTAFAGVHDVFITDFHAVWERWSAKFIKGPINTNTEITGIDRSGPLPVVKFKGQKEPHSGGGYGSKGGNGWGWGGGFIAPDWWHYGNNGQACSSVILAFPPSLTNLKAVGLKLTGSEEEVFSEVGIQNYYASAVNFNLPNGIQLQAATSSVAVPPPEDGEPVAGLRLQASSDVITWWSLGPYRKFQAEEFARELLRTTLSKFNKDPRNATAMSMAVKESDIKAFRKWDYFPHFDSAPLKDNFYDKFNKLQGQKKTFYASAISGFEIVEWAIQSGQDLVDSHF